VKTDSRVSDENRRLPRGRNYKSKKLLNSIALLDKADWKVALHVMLGDNHVKFNPSLRC